MNRFCIFAECAPDVAELHRELKKRRLDYVLHEIPDGIRKEILLNLWVKTDEKGLRKALRGLQGGKYMLQTLGTNMRETIEKEEALQLTKDHREEIHPSLN